MISYCWFWWWFGAKLTRVYTLVSALSSVNHEQKWPPKTRRHFEKHFLQWKCVDFAQIWKKVYSMGMVTNLWLVIVDFADGLLPNLSEFTSWCLHLAVWILNKNGWPKAGGNFACISFNKNVCIFKKYFTEVYSFVSNWQLAIIVLCNRLVLSGHQAQLPKPMMRMIICE